MRKTVSTTISIGAFSGATVADFYAVCRMFDVNVVSCNKIGGLFVKTYHVTIEGRDLDIAKVAGAFRG